MNIYTKIHQKITEMPFIQKYPSIIQFIKFVIVGFSNLFIDFCIYLLLTRIFGIYYLIANFFGFTIATVNSFFLNKKWTFRDKQKDSKKQYIKFYIANAAGLLINQTILYLFVELMDLNDITSKGIATIVVTFWNFALSKFWTFKKTPEITTHNTNI